MLHAAGTGGAGRREAVVHGGARQLLEARALRRPPVARADAVEHDPALELEADLVEGRHHEPLLALAGPLLLLEEREELVGNLGESGAEKQRVKCR